MKCAPAKGFLKGKLGPAIKMYSKRFFQNEWNRYLLNSTELSSPELPETIKTTWLPIMNFPHA